MKLQSAEGYSLVAAWGSALIAVRVHSLFVMDCLLIPFIPNFSLVVARGLLFNCGIWAPL